MYGAGISHSGDVLDLGTEVKVVTKGGSWYSYEDTRLGQGRETAKNFLDENPALMREIENKIRVHYGMPELDAIETSIANAEVNPIDDDEAIKATSDEKFKKEFSEDALEIDLDEE